ncbi:Hypothetical_protein [Hexamita inflata]|uniref:Hypothetical_protein n=1 Tax=Hexamita inflata TaxID=28002 RepID=A0AA86QLJ3_9EUKA|nr:Hypothetical protein HINF_LOCUS49429 [Hexamita inflata]
MLTAYISQRARQACGRGHSGCRVRTTIWLQQQKCNNKNVSYKSSGYSWFLIIPVVIALIIGISVYIYKKTKKTGSDKNVQNTFVNQLGQNATDQVIVAEQQ